jgi:hypothetical protein
MRLVNKFPFLLNLCFIFVGYFGWIQDLQKQYDFLAINFPVSIQWYSCLIEQCHCSLSIVKGQLNSSINKAPLHFAETENLQQEDSDAERIACGQGSLNRSRRGGKLMHILQQLCRMLEPWLLYKSAPMPIRQCGVPKHQRRCLQVGVGCSLKGAHGCNSKEVGG